VTAAILTAALLIGAECQQVRVYHSQHQLASIAAMLASGARDALSDVRGRLSGGTSDVQLDWQSVRLTFGDKWHLQYSLTFRGLRIIKQTWVGLDHFSMRADISGRISEDLDAVMFAFVATQSADGTRITSWLWVHTPRGDRCFLVRRIAENRVMPPLVANALAKVESAVVELSHRGQGSDVLAIVIDAVRGGAGWRRADAGWFQSVF